MKYQICSFSLSYKIISTESFPRQGENAATLKTHCITYNYLTTPTILLILIWREVDLGIIQQFGVGHRALKLIKCLHVIAEALNSTNLARDCIPLNVTINLICILLMLIIFKEEIILQKEHVSQKTSVPSRIFRMHM